MRAIVLDKLGGLDGLVYKDIPKPEPKAGHVVIQIKARLRSVMSMTVPI
jgi:NADPH:quinone reductase-like Zn-dependent oxidoreductase